MSTALTTIKADDLFTAWIGQSPARQRARGRRPRPSHGRLRFAFYGRISTTGYQDPASSRQWQHDNVTRLILGHGTIIAEYFDTGYSRSLPWHQRPGAAALLRDAARPDRGFEAVVIGEYERAARNDVTRAASSQVEAVLRYAANEDRTTGLHATPETAGKPKGMTAAAAKPITASRQRYPWGTLRRVGPLSTVWAFGHARIDR
jgi:hypothetical protein